MVPLASSGMTLLVVNTTRAWGLIFDIIWLFNRRWPWNRG